ncbi:hypothetical protein ABBQ38_012379 [Trebouxia sp. C0009 RCD-2024]
MIATPPGVYPVRGVVHLCRRPSLNKRVGGFLAGMSAASLGGVVALAWGTYGAQLRFVGQRLGTGIWGKLVTSLLILGEASVPLYFAFNQSMILLQQKLFEDVLKEQGVHPVRQISGSELGGLNAYMQAKAAKHAAEKKARKTIQGRAIHYASSAAVSAMTSPLASVVPFAPVLLSLASGDKATVPFMSQYLRMRGIESYQEQQAVAEAHKLAYRQFGIAAALLSAIPVASWAFAFSNTVGAALWAADMEKRDEQLF